jgi:cell wall-associated NlpC family hydrolase
MNGQLTFQENKKNIGLPAFNFLQHAAVQPTASLVGPESAETVSHSAQDFSQVAARADHTPSCAMTPTRCPFGGACHTCPTQVQAKLAISQPGDEYEQEADRVAEMVMRMPEPTDDEKECNLPGCKQPLQRQAANGVTPDDVPPIVHEVLRSPGQPLDATTRAFMEPRFGHDLGSVRIHVDKKAIESARAVSALAFTVGQNLMFGEGSFAPATTIGKQLLAHELAHVIQQKGDSPEFLRRRCGDTTPPSQNQASTRAEIVRHAISQIGEHYLWSAEGQLPGLGDVITHPLYQCVAQVSSGCVCAGKHLDPDVSARQKIQQSVSEANLPSYISTYSFLRKEGAGNCGGGCGATPGSDIWGDCCFGHRHFDCSGLVFWCYNQARYSINRMTVGGYQACDRNIVQANLQPGDLCYIGNTHVGIYVGDNQVVEARSHAHGVVLSGLAGRGWTSYGSFFEAT